MKSFILAWSIWALNCMLVFRIPKHAVLQYLHKPATYLWIESELIRYNWIAANKHLIIYKLFRRSAAEIARFLGCKLAKSSASLAIFITLCALTCSKCYSYSKLNLLLQENLYNLWCANACTWSFVKFGCSWFSKHRGFCDRCMFY